MLILRNIMYVSHNAIDAMLYTYQLNDENQTLKKIDL